MTHCCSLVPIVIVTLNTPLSQACLKQAVSGVRLPAGPSSAGALTSLVAGSPSIRLAAVPRVVGFGLWMVIVPREKLAVAVAVS